MYVQYQRSTQKTKAACLCQPIILSMGAILCDSTVVFIVVVVRTRPRAIPLAMITMKKSTHGFPFASHMSTGLRLAELRYYVLVKDDKRVEEMAWFWGLVRHYVDQYENP